MTTDLVSLANTVRDAHAEYLYRFYGRHSMSESTAAHVRLIAAKKALRAAWMRAPKHERTEAIVSASTHCVRSGDCPHAAISSRERLEDLVNLPCPE